MDSIALITSPATGSADVARKLMRYLRLDDARRVIDWRRMDGGAHRESVSALADFLLGAEFLPPGTGERSAQARQYEEAAFRCVELAARIDALIAAAPGLDAELAELEELVLTAAEKARPHPDLPPSIDAALAAITAKYDAAEQAAGITPLRRALDDLASRADALRADIEAAGLLSIDDAAARLRVLACDRLMGDDPHSDEWRQLSSALDDLERAAGIAAPSSAAA